ncbi:MAG: hypothetical protein LBQ79_04570 [Deltaproteobacteria bacterium]|jgi:hypothetical protein|nr:hypothetical protein [Deltaproteobacteria bacterium]
MPKTPPRGTRSRAPRALRPLPIPALALLLASAAALATIPAAPAAAQLGGPAQQGGPLTPPPTGTVQPPQQPGQPVPSPPGSGIGAPDGNALSSLDRASAAHSVGDNVTAILSVWEAMQSIWNMMGVMGIRNATFVMEEPEFFGIYQPKQGQDFAPGELVILYCEPFGYTMRQESDGTYTNSLRWSFKILDQAGSTMGGQNDIGPYTHGGYRTFIMEKMLALTINLSQFPAGSYVLSVTITDDFNSQKSVEIQKPFNILASPQ